MGCFNVNVLVHLNVNVPDKPQRSPLPLKREQPTKETRFKLYLHPPRLRCSGTFTFTSTSR